MDKLVLCLSVTKQKFDLGTKPANTADRDLAGPRFLVSLLCSQHGASEDHKML